MFSQILNQIDTGKMERRAYKKNEKNGQTKEKEIKTIVYMSHKK